MLVCTLLTVGLALPYITLSLWQMKDMITKPGDRIDTFLSMMEEDGGDYFAILQRFTTGYVDLHWPNDACAADDAVAAWYARVNEILPLNDLPTLSCSTLKTVLAIFMELVSAIHTHVGSISAEVNACPHTYRHTSWYAPITRPSHTMR